MKYVHLKKIVRTHVARSRHVNVVDVVVESLTWFVEIYPELASWRGVTNRLTAFAHSLEVIKQNWPEVQLKSDADPADKPGGAQMQEVCPVNRSKQSSMSATASARYHASILGCYSSCFHRFFMHLDWHGMRQYLGYTRDHHDSNLFDVR